MTQQLDIPSSTPMKVNAKSKATQAVSRKRLPVWASVLIATNGIGLLGVSIAFANPALTNRVLHHPRVAPWIERVFPSGLSMRAETPPTPAPIGGAAVREVSALSDRTSLTYEQWLEVLKQEAAAVAKQQPERLTVLLGDSLSLWFPADQLPSDRTWLNQGISGDTTAAMVKRISFLDETKPQTLFVMAGINDFKKGSTVDEVLESYRTMIQNFKQKHPSSEIVIQAVLPHGAEMTGVDDSEQVLAIPNDQIVKFNQKLASLAKEEQILFLNLHPLFADKEGFLRSDLTTDGLHLNPSGYLVWSTALQTFSQTQLRNSDVAIPTAQASPETVPVNSEVQ